MENESYLHITSPITHFQSVDQYYTMFKIKRRPFDNQLDFWQNISEKRTLLVLIINNWQLQPMQCSPPQAGMYDMKF